MDQVLENMEDTGSSYYDSQYKNIYAQQYGSGLDPYSGYRYQFSGRNLRGNGIWSTIKGGLAPIFKSLLPYLGGSAVDAMTGLASEIKRGKTFKEAAKTQARKTGSKMALDLSEKLAQTGEGTKRRNKRGNKVNRKLCRRKRRRRRKAKKINASLVIMKSKKRRKKNVIRRRRKKTSQGYLFSRQ